MDIMRTGVRWSGAYPLRTRHGEGRMLARGVHVDHSTVSQWVITDSPQLEEAFHRRTGVPETTTSDGSDAKEAAIKRSNAAHGITITLRHVQCLNTIVEQDRRAVKRVTRPLLGFKSFEAAQGPLTGGELIESLRVYTRLSGYHISV